MENSQCMNAIESLVDSLDDNLDMIWHVGDFAYDMCDDNGQNTDRFMNMVEPIASKGSALQKNNGSVKTKSSVYDDPWQPREPL